MKARGVGSALGQRTQCPNQYSRQYVGIVVSKRKLIYINAFCDPGARAAWHRRAVTDACDGGGCFRGVFCDMTNTNFLISKLTGWVDGSRMGRIERRS
jgi:hypothetical protein